MRSRGALVVIEHSTESGPSANPTCGLHRWSAGNQDVTQPLVIPLAMVMGNVLRERATKVTFADRDDPIQAFGLNRSHDAFSVRVGIGCARGRLHDLNAGVAYRMLGSLSEAEDSARRSSSRCAMAYEAALSDRAASHGAPPASSFLYLISARG
jgi:hypothetical protein